MTDIAGMNDELRRMRKRVDFVYGGLQRGGDIRIRGLVESDMAIADLDEVKFALGSGGRSLAESPRAEDAAADGPENSGAGPSHALQESASIDAVVVVVVDDES